MKRILFFCILFIFNYSASQIVKGKVVDEENNPLPGANIYFDGTTIATITDQNGDFKLSYGSKLNSILAISFIGYQTQYTKTFTSDTALLIVLKESENSLREVVVRKGKFSRSQKLKLFKEQFLGQTKFGKKAIIQNEGDLDFEYDESKKTLRASSDKPLLIYNTILGYKITYELVDFEVAFWRISIDSHDVIRSFYAGLSRFEEVVNTIKINKEREKCYQGSQLHFFRNLANESVWNKDSFLLFKGSYGVTASEYFTISDTLDTKKVVIKKFSKELTLKKAVAEFNILFNNKQQSKIIFYTDTFYVDKFGNNSNIENIMFSGYMTQNKFGGTLPVNYGIE